MNLVGDHLWGCGYRNFLMACTALMYQQDQPSYFSLLDDPDAPLGLRHLQTWLERAWKAGMATYVISNVFCRPMTNLNLSGYDPEGAKDFKYKLHGSSRWIGTGELYVAFTAKGIHTRLVDFPKSKTTTNRETAHALTRWVVDYFGPPMESQPSPFDKPVSAFEAIKKPTPVTISQKMPVILQHKGHSRTIVGYEIAKDGSTNLLLFDPARYAYVIPSYRILLTRITAKTSTNRYERSCP